MPERPPRSNVPRCAARHVLLTGHPEVTEGGVDGRAPGNPASGQPRLPVRSPSRPSVAAALPGAAVVPNPCATVTTSPSERALGEEVIVPPYRGARFKREIRHLLAFPCQSRQSASSQRPE